MINKTIKNFHEFHDLVASIGGPSSIYRGQKDIEKYKLQPSIGRYAKYFTNSDDLFRREIFSLRIFRLECVKEIGSEPQNWWKTMVLAQHHGLPTRLLDWSRNPLVALFFAIEKEFHGDRVVYAMSTNDLLYVDNDSELKYDPFKLNQVAIYLPAHCDSKISNQQSIFTVHPCPIPEFDHKELYKIRILESARVDILNSLELFQINRSTLFPDLYGLASYLIKSQLMIGYA